MGANMALVRQATTEACSCPPETLGSRLASCIQAWRAVASRRAQLRDWLSSYWAITVERRLAACFAAWRAFLVHRWGLCRVLSYIGMGAG